MIVQPRMSRLNHAEPDAQRIASFSPSLFPPLNPLTGCPASCRESNEPVDSLNIRTGSRTPSSDQLPYLQLLASALARLDPRLDFITTPRHRALPDQDRFRKRLIFYGRVQTRPRQSGHGTYKLAAQ